MVPFMSPINQEGMGNMKRLAIVSAAVLAVLSLSSAAWAGFGIGVKAGYVAPMGDFSDNFDGAMGYGAMAELTISPDFSLTFNALLHEHEVSGGGEGKVKFTDLTADGRWYFGGNTKFFLAAGGGMYQYEFDGGDSESDWGFKAGGGLLFKVGEQMSLSVEGFYNSFSVDTPDGGSDTIDFVTATGNLLFMF